MKTVFIILLVLISGCATAGDMQTDRIQEEVYVRKAIFAAPAIPEWRNYAEVVDQQTYRRMPSYVKDLYEKVSR
jgi:hypothetical protein